MKNLTSLFCIASLFFLLSCEGPPGPPGKDGANGLSIDYRGEFDSPPSNPIVNWVYRNTIDNGVYIYNGTAWVLMVHDGANGTNGANGADGRSIFVTYNDNPVSNPPQTPTGDGTLPAGWHTNSTEAVVWISQKISIDANSGTWGAPIRIRGADGKDGNFVYFEGFKPDLKCGACHTPEEDTVYFKSARTFQWAASKHANGGTSIENLSSCAECHTTEGFIQKMNGKPVTQILNATPVGCFACHSPHAKGDFSARQTAPVTLLSNFIGVADYTFDYGTGNLCAQCHKPRAQFLKLDPSKSTITSPTDSIIITTSRWYPHYGVQSQMLIGKGGYEWVNGPVQITNSYHTVASQIKTDGCISCHMPAAAGNYGGGHTMKLRYEFRGSNSQVTTGCTISGCHTVPFVTLDYNGKMTEVQQNLDTLKVLLAQLQWLDTLTMTVKATSIKPLVVAPSNKAGALWNFFMVQNDGSSGVHNTHYANALLRNSIAKMRGEF